MDIVGGRGQGIGLTHLCCGLDALLSPAPEMQTGHQGAK